MKQMTTIRILLSAWLLALLPGVTNAQPFAATGSRAAGMGGAFVAVADDASAFYWNPAGLAPGAFFSLVLDGGSGEALPSATASGGDASSFLIALTTPALGLGYYRLHARTASVVPFDLVPLISSPSGRALSGVTEVRVDSLLTHHGGITLVQSLAQGVAVGSTLKLVRGIAASQRVLAGGPSEALGGDAAEVLGRASTTFDLDVGLMVHGGPLKAGLTIRNVREPKFRAAGGGLEELMVPRQARAGVSYTLSTTWLAALDLDLLETDDTFGRRRDIAAGVEGRLTPRLAVRSGVTVNMAGEADRAAALSAGASYAVRGSIFIDGHFSTGNGRAGSSWGAAARFVY